VTQPASICGYEILSELGRGTTGVVYKARHSLLKPDRLVALKIPSLGSVSEAPKRLAWYDNEWRALVKLTWELDPTVPTLYDVGGGVPGQPNYYAREFVDGSTLEQLVATGSASLRKGIRILATLAGAVQRMHGLWIAHRNLQPSNVLIRTDGTPKLIGFGFVWPLAGADGLPPGMAGESAEVDVRALQKMLGWLCATSCQPVPARLEPVWQPGSVRSPGSFAEALSNYS
jgi:serine/threonine protein kinase